MKNLLEFYLHMDEKTPTNVSDDHVQIMVVSEEMQQPNDNNPPVTRDINSKVSCTYNIYLFQMLLIRLK